MESLSIIYLFIYKLLFINVQSVSKNVRIKIHVNGFTLGITLVYFSDVSLIKEYIYVVYYQKDEKRISIVVCSVETAIIT